MKESCGVLDACPHKSSASDSKGVRAQTFDEPMESNRIPYKIPRFRLNFGQSRGDCESIGQKIPAPP